jgi:hypothetical protein
VFSKLKNCSTHKKQFMTEGIAEEALLAAWTTYSYKQGSGPVAIYLCSECGTYHLTSQGPMNKKLAESLANGEIDRQKDSNAWMDKIKGRRRN